MNTIEFLRSFKILGYAIFDLSVTFIGMYLLAPFLSGLFRRIHIDIPKRNWLYFALPIGIIVHILVGNITPMTKQFLDPNGYYLLKLLILGLAILGFQGIEFRKGIEEV